jgi:hypothetical protein
VEEVQLTLREVVEVEEGLVYSLIFVMGAVVEEVPASYL